MDKVTHLADHHRELKGRGGNGGGDGFNRRLSEIEEKMARMETDISWIKTTTATKNDITNLKVWILGGVLGGIGVAVGIALTGVKAFL